MTEEIKKRGKWGYFVGSGILLILLVIGGIYLFIQEEKYVGTNDAFIDSYRIDLSPDILARVIELKVDEGDAVKQGDVVAILQQDIFLSQKVEAEAALESSIRNVSFQKAHLEKVQNDYIRATKGIKDRIISSQEFDHFQKDYEMSEASYNKALADTVLAESKVQLINTYLNHTLIYAPFDGTIAKRWIFTGDVMRPGQSIFTMYDRQRVWVQANLSEKKIEKVKIGDPVEISVDAYPNKTFYGKVFTIKSAAASQFSVIPQNNATGNYTKVAQRIPIKITLDSAYSDNKLYLFPGMNVEVKIKVQGS
ncbi:MAG: HlyD family secretion protein [Simkaniaceae bacterium]|nr:MAG: HlyD family secretion protein [Simkaniaceae bacterium]